MTDQELFDIDISSRWGIAAIGLTLAGGVIVIARIIGPEAVEMLINGSLMLIFMVGGTLLGLLSVQALGASQQWGLSENEESQLVEIRSKPHSRSLAEFAKEIDEEIETNSDDEDIDPFYEILKQNRSTGRAA